VDQLLSNRQRRLRQRLRVSVIAIVAVLISVIAVAMILRSATTHTVSSKRAYDALHSESKLVPASQDVAIETTVTDENILPGWLYGQQAVVAAKGRVEAYIDLSEVQPDDIRINGTKAVVTLPPVRFSDPSIRDIEWKSDNRGLVNRISEVFTRDDTFRSKVIDQLNKELAAKGFGSRDLKKQAEDAIPGLLQRLLGPTGVDTVEVKFRQPAAP
jgi:hypothetical protein